MNATSASGPRARSAACSVAERDVRGGEHLGLLARVEHDLGGRVGGHTERAQRPEVLGHAANHRGRLGIDLASFGRASLGRAPLGRRLAQSRAAVLSDRARDEQGRTEPRRGTRDQPSLKRARAHPLLLAPQRSHRSRTTSRPPARSSPEVEPGVVAARGSRASSTRASGLRQAACAKRGRARRGRAPLGRRCLAGGRAGSRSSLHRDARLARR